MIRKDDILKATDKGIHVFRHYLGKDFKVGKNFLNPFYRDTKAPLSRQGFQGGEEFPEPILPGHESIVQYLLRPQGGGVQDEGFRQRGIFG